MITWSANGEKVYTWPTNHRVQDLAISTDGQRLVTISTEKQIFVYNLIRREEEYSLRLKTYLTCVNISRDSNFVLVNMADNELQLIDIDSAEIVRRFIGQKQGKFVIRSTFGGAEENLVITGSEGKFNPLETICSLLINITLRWKDIHLPQRSWNYDRDS